MTLFIYINGGVNLLSSVASRACAGEDNIAGGDSQTNQFAGYLLL